MLDTHTCIYRLLFEALSHTTLKMSKYDLMRESGKRYACMYVCMSAYPQNVKARLDEEEKKDVCMYVCMYVCLHFLKMSKNDLTRKRRKMCVCMYVCMYVCLHTLKISKYDLMRESGKMYSCMFVCMYVYIPSKYPSTT